MSDPIAAFEKNTKDLVSSIQHYKPDVELANTIIHDQDRIGDEINQLRKLNQSYREYDTSLQLKDTQLSTTLKECLLELVDCKRSLDSLPKLNESGKIDDKLDDTDTNTILSYALKLSKFTKIPRTFDGFLLPNNFIWPGDDNMRRGNLAIASMMPDKIVNMENYGPDYVPPVVETAAVATTTTGVEMKDVGDDDDEDDDDDDFEEFIPERSNAVSSNTGSSTTNGVMTGLDLLDSDDE